MDLIAREGRLRTRIWWLLLLVAVADWLLLRLGVLRHHPRWLAVLASAVLLTAGVRLIELVIGLRSAKGPHLARVGEAVVLFGLVLAVAAGFANWLLGFQGFVVLVEGEGVPLHQGKHLQEIVVGPLGRSAELEVTVTLVGVDLQPDGERSVSPVSRLLLQRAHEIPEEMHISRHAGGAWGSLRLFQGAFGFAPRVVIARGEETFLDELVPFETERRGDDGSYSFDGRFTVSREGLDISGSVDLSSLDEDMRGHATLRLELRKDGKLLGRGAILPGHFAELPEGLRVGFAGLGKWSEIVISRRNYADWVIAGVGVAFFGLVVWLAARWVGR